MGKTILLTLFLVGLAVLLSGCLEPPATCGNGQADAGENCSNCSADVQCADGESCMVGTCVVMSACIEEGQTMPLIANPPDCCEGLELIPPNQEDIVGIAGICTAKCGNGNCDTETENAFNCQLDCQSECRDETYTCTPEDIPCCEGLEESTASFLDEGICMTPTCGTICLPCGDDVCDEELGENRCNCLDCGECSEEGEEAMPPYACCDGLELVEDCPEGEECAVSVKYCVDCGNGTCDEHENSENCPEDCE